MIRFTASLALALLILLVSDTAFACTSFASYAGPSPIFAMNFDYAHLPMKLLMETHGDIKTFHLAFEKEIGEVKFFAKTGGMNNKGLFYACQELDPAQPNPPTPSETNLPLPALNEMIGTSTKVSQLKAVADLKQIVQVQGVTLHTLFADATGDAVIMEPDNETCHLTAMDGKWIVMANFANHTLTGKSIQDAQGLGDYRFKIMHKRLKENGEALSPEEAMRILSDAKNRNPECPTTCSMVFTPKNAEVFICFHRDFETLWRVSINGGTLECIKGDQKGTKHAFNKKGVEVANLMKQE